MADYKARALTHRPLSVVEDADAVRDLGLDPDMIAVNTPNAIIALQVELGSASPTIYPDMEAFLERFIPAPQEAK